MGSSVPCDETHFFLVYLTRWQNILAPNALLIRTNPLRTQLDGDKSCRAQVIGRHRTSHIDFSLDRFAPIPSFLSCSVERSHYT